MSLLEDYRRIPEAVRRLMDPVLCRLPGVGGKFRKYTTLARLPLCQRYVESKKC